MVESGEEVFGVGGYLGSRCALALLTDADLKPDIISTHNPLSSFHTLDSENLEMHHFFFFFLRGTNLFWHWYEKPLFEWDINLTVLI